MEKLMITACVGLLSLSSIGTASAVTGTASAGNLTVTFTVNDVTFPGPGCLQAPIQTSFSSSGSLEITASKAGSSNSISAFTYGEGGEVVSDSIQICPNIDGPGVYEIRGTINGDDTSAALPQGLTFTVSAAPATISGLRAIKRGKSLIIKGKATAPSDRGRIGTQGEVAISGYLSKKSGGKGKWIPIGTTYANEFGNFSINGPTAQKLKGLKVKATLKGDGWFSGAIGETTLR